IDMNIRDSFWTPPSDMSKRDVKRPLPVRPLRCIRDPRFNQHVHMFKWFSQPPVPPAISIAPEVDVVEYEGCFKLYFDMPSINKDSIHIYVKQSVLVVEGTRVANYHGCRKVLFQRRRLGVIRHQIPYNPSVMDVRNAVATYNNGELCITVQKTSSF
ncbi:hypothetical protein BLSTO_04930, partial [Blastocystis sp. subtype 1]